MQNNELKSYFLVRKLFKKYEQQLAVYVSYTDRVCNADYFAYNLYNSLPLVYSSADVNIPEYFAICNRRKQRKLRARKYLQKMFALPKANLQFITLTFNDSSLQLKESVRREYVTRWCKDNCFDYFGNIDYGDNTHREHYHVVADLRDFYDQWPYGFMYVKPINTKSKDLTRINKYLHKLVNHAGKYTTGSSFHKRKSSKTLVEVFDLDLDKLF